MSSFRCWTAVLVLMMNFGWSLGSPARAQSAASLVANPLQESLAPPAARGSSFKVPKEKDTANRSELITFAKQAAEKHSLPSDFFLRLIRQESGFNTRSVSGAGALGIAQFMPQTAKERGLKDPFDPLEALPKSAELLRDLYSQFGNLGLAAAAYNAGPNRIRAWLEGRSSLPQETRHYVAVITGQPAEKWVDGVHPILPFSAEHAFFVTRLERSVRMKRAPEPGNWEYGMLPENARELLSFAAPARRTRTSFRTPQRAPSIRVAGRNLCSQCIVQSAY
jgi:Transglycosylase SLT domain